MRNVSRSQVFLHIVDTSRVLKWKRRAIRYEIPQAEVANRQLADPRRYSKAAQLEAKDFAKKFKDDMSYFKHCEC